MAERLWSGDGCDGNPAFEFVKHSDSGVALYRKIAAAAVELKSASAVHVVKRDDASRAGGEEMGSNVLSDAVAKALAEAGGDERAEMVRKQLALGLTSVEKIAAELALESIAKRRREADPSRSFEQHFVDALTAPENADLVRTMMG